MQRQSKENEGRTGDKDSVGYLPCEASGCDVWDIQGVVDHVKEKMLLRNAGLQEACEYFEKEFAAIILCWKNESRDFKEHHLSKEKKE